MRLITADDIIDVYTKSKQRGVDFLLSKLNFRGISRTKSAFNESAKHSSNWWIIPKVNERWNMLITGNPQINYKQYLMDDILSNESDLKLLSLGSGSSGLELELAEYPNFKEIICVDIAQNRLSEAEQIAENKKLENIQFICSNIDDYDIPDDYFDMVLFKSSLHHMDNVEDLLKGRINKCLKHSGKLIIYEYVGPSRLQFPSHQRKEINKALKLVPVEYRKRYKTNLTKKRFYGSGIIKMILADPSECIDSSSILPSIHSNFATIFERPYGGNIIMNVLKDISHHFMEMDTHKEEVLNKLFSFEDEYLKTHSSDYVFGIYEKLKQ